MDERGLKYPSFSNEIGGEEANQNQQADAFKLRNQYANPNSQQPSADNQANTYRYNSIYGSGNSTYGNSSQQNVYNSVNTQYSNTQNVNTQYSNTQNINTQYSNTQNINTQYSNTQNVNTQYRSSVNGYSTYGNPQNANAQYGNNVNVNSSYSNNTYANSQYGNGSYANSQYGNSYYGNYSYDNYSYKRTSSKKVWVVVLIPIVIVFAMIFGISMMMERAKEQSNSDAYEIELELEDKYDIKIRIGEDANVNESGFEIEYMTNGMKNKKALESIEKILDRLPEGFIDEMMDGYSDGRYLEINVTGEMVQEDGNRDLLGLTSYKPEKTIIRMNADVSSFDEFATTFAHELFHAMDFEMNQFNENKGCYKRWENKNPIGFEYSQDEGLYDDYLLQGDKLKNVYFISAYSKEGIYEDRAEVFSYLLATDEDNDLPKSYESAHIKNKVDLLIEEIDTAFDTVYDGNAYWEQWY